MGSEKEKERDGLAGTFVKVGKTKLLSGEACFLLLV